MLKGKQIAIVNPMKNKFDKLFERFFMGELTNGEWRNDVRVVHPTNPKDMVWVAEWADIILSMWSAWPMVTLTSMPKIKGKLITFCRSYEVLNEGRMVTEKINWEKVDGVIFVANHVLQHARKIMPEMTDRINVPKAVIPNGVDFGAAMLPYVDHVPTHGRNIGYVGYLNHKKGIPLLCQAIDYITANWGEFFKWHIAGSHQDPRFETYMRHFLGKQNLEQHVQFHGWQDDILEWLVTEEISYVINTSPWEGNPNSINEAMALGIMPLIHGFVGAEDQYPEKYIWYDVERLLDMLNGKNYVDPRETGKYAFEHFNFTINAKRVEQFIEEVI